MKKACEIIVTTSSGYRCFRGSFESMAAARKFCRDDEVGFQIHFFDLNGKFIKSELV